jgi:LDH2 family malate/lactate/ureidoglycolate dehydrogenase
MPPNLLCFYNKNDHFVLVLREMPTHISRSDFCRWWNARCGRGEHDMLKIVSHDRLRRFVDECYRVLGVPGDASALLADSLVQADLWGHQSHGVMRTFWYADRFISGATSVKAEPEWVTDVGALAVLDGHNGIGQVMAKTVVLEAVKRAKRHGIGAVAVRNSNHFGTAMYFSRLAALEGCIGFLSTNASPAMAPWGGREKRVGNNPWSIAAPAGKYSPMILDIANTAVARGKLYLARQKGELIPTTWALDKDGAPTTDPVAGIAGTILPMAGHKGYAISMMMDVLSGVLSGSCFGTDVFGPYQAEKPGGVGHLALAVDIARCRPLSEFNSDMEQMIERVKKTPLAADSEEIFYPGEKEARADECQRRDGLALPVDTVEELNRRATELRVDLLV